MYLVLLTACVAIIVGVVAVAMGRGGELAHFRRDLPAARPRIATPADVAALRLPIGLLGYQAQATVEALRAAARLLAERDAEIARLRGLLGGTSAPDDQRGPAGPGAVAGAGHLSGTRDTDPGTGSQQPGTRSQPSQP
ncbi:MAG TPA: hypothetical protein VNF47_12820 [Streptosporangiaceae bacterium]|nr:hypothetical protein [Streptosporangiaceae bacterium]